MDQPKAHSFNLPPINFGNGLVEVGALTTLIGSTIAAVLVLGTKGPAGLVWGAISAFGSSSIIKACASGASPGWLRQMFSLRTPISDSAMGMDLPLSPSSKVAQMVRSTLGEPVGVSCDAKILAHASPSNKGHSSCRDVYAFDHDTQLLLDGLPATLPGEMLRVYEYASYPFFRPHHARQQISLLCLSLIKYVEAYFLSRKSTTMAILSSAPFTFFLLAAIGLEIKEIISSRQPMDTDGSLDIVAGPLPSTKQPAGPRKVFLGSKDNSRRTLWWKLMWAVGATLYTVSLLMSYVLLGQQPVEVVVTWGLFQVVWLVLRILISYLKTTSELTANRRVVANPVEALTPAMKLRVANLIFAVAKGLENLHPRGPDGYSEDSYSTFQIAQIFKPNITQVYALQEGNTHRIELHVVAVIGDVTLSSAAWTLGSTLSSMDLYDSCIVILGSSVSQRQPQKLIAIPSVRVMTARAAFQMGVDGTEKADPLFVPRTMGGGSEVTNPEWMYWVPCSSGHWLQFRSTKLSSLGKRTADVMSDEELTKLLNVGTLHISLKNSFEVNEIVDNSRRAAELLMSVFN